MALVVSPLARCPSCAAVDPAPVSAHLGRSGWSCSYCGGPARSLASPLAVARCSLGTLAGRWAFELRAGRCSAWAPVRWWARR